MKKIFFIGGLLLVICFFGACSKKEQVEVVDNTIDENYQLVQFQNINSTEPDSIKTLQSLKREGGLFMITYYGDYNDRLERLNDRIIQYGIGSVIPPEGAYSFDCSIFSGLGNTTSPILGRNLDNYNVERGVLVGLYNPPNGYASIAVSNMYHLGFGRYEDPMSLPIEDRLDILNCVLFADDGVNERGVSVALASIDPQTIVRNENNKLASLSYVMREILDHAGDLEEAIEIVEGMDMFDQSTSIISHHLLIADANGNSAVTEYINGEWRIIRNTENWQIATNEIIYSRNKATLRNLCSRYRTADDYLENVEGSIDWEGGMQILDDVSVNGTQWSSVYDLANRELYIVLHRMYNEIFLVRL